jgi:hypothetical protein
MQIGYAALERSLGMAVVRSLSGGQVRSEAAVPAATLGTSFRVYVERTAITSTGLAMLNTGTNPASVTLRLSDGRQTALQIPAKGQRTQFIHELITDIGASFSGTLAITSDVPIGIVALRGTFSQTGEFLMSTVPISAGASTTSPLVFPQVADGGGYSTELLLLNGGAAAISGTVEFSVAVDTDAGTNAKFQYDIPAFGIWKLRTTGVRTDGTSRFRIHCTRGGCCRARSNRRAQANHGRASGFEAGVPAVSTLTRGVMFAVSKGSVQTVLSLVNRSAGTATVQLTAYRPNGTVAVSATPISLGPGEHKPRFLDDLVPELAGFEGTVVLESTAPIYVITLRTLTSVSGAFLMTPMPLLDLNQGSTPGTSYFPQLVDGGNYSTEYLLLSATGSSADCSSLIRQGSRCRWDFSKDLIDQSRTCS